MADGHVLKCWQDYIFEPEIMENFSPEHLSLNSMQAMGCQLSAQLL